MSIIKNISTYPSTGRGFTPVGNKIENISGVFLVKSTFSATATQLATSNYLFSQFEAGNVIPLHLVQSVQSNNEGIQIQNSIQDYDYKLRDGKYKHTLRFDWDDAVHQVVDSYSGTDLYVVYYDNSGKLILANNGDSTYRGIKTDSIILQKQLFFGNGAEPVYSDLNIELQSGETIEAVATDWYQEEIDKLFVTINILVAQPTYLNFTIKQNSTSIENIGSEDITITDNANGVITGILLDYSDGVYQASGFNPNITSGCLSVNATAYLGRKAYRVNVLTGVAVGFDLLDADGFDMLDGDTFNLLETS